MDVAILSQTSAWGGSEVHTAGLARTLAGRGHRVTIVALGADVFGARPEFRDCRGVEVRKPLLPGPIDRLSFGRCLAALRGLRADVGLMVRSGMEVGSLRLDLAARLRFGRYITIEHGCAEMLPRSSRRHLFGLVPGVGLWWRRLRWLWRLRSSIPERVVCVSERTRERLIRNVGMPRRRVIAIPNGIDPTRFRPDPARRAAARRAWGVPEGALVLGAVGRLDPVKGYDLAIDLFRRLAARRPDRDLRLVLIGDGDERDNLKRAAEASGFGDRVIFPGFTDRSHEAYPGLDVFLLPSREEGLPLALLEAMACECYPIAFGVGGVPDVLGGAGAGRLVAPGDAEAFLAAMDEAVEMDAARRLEAGQAARRYVEAHFDAAAQFEALARLVERRRA